MRFLADMGVPSRTVAWLRSSGYDAVHIRDEGMQRASDSEIIEKSRTEQRIILTMDLDFGYLMAVSKAQLPSIIIFRLDDERPTSVNRRLEDVIRQFEDALNSGCIISTSESNIRVRPLPII